MNNGLQTQESALAINGGPKVRDVPMPVRKLFGSEERDAVMRLMDRAMADGLHLMGYGGREEQAYCELFAEQLGGGYADGVNSGTNAVYAAVASLGLEPGSEVVVPPITDPGGVMPVAMLGYVPVAADSAPDAFNTDARQIEQVLTDRTRAILVTHIGGIPVDMDPVLALAKAKNLAVVEDCAQAHGAKYNGQPVGTLGDIAAFSTMFGKHHFSGGQGGLVFTRREDLHRSARRWADRGKAMGLPGNGNVHCSLNCNMDELHATIGRANLAKLPGFVERRRRVALRVAEACQALDGVSVLTERAGDEASYWFVTLKLDLDALRVDRRGFIDAMAAEGIEGLSGYAFFPMRMTWATERWPMPALSNARAAEARHCRFSIHEGWTDVDADDVIAALTKVMSAYRK